MLPPLDTRPFLKIYKNYLKRIHNFAKYCDTVLPKRKKGMCILRYTCMLGFNRYDRRDHRSIECILRPSLLVIVDLWYRLTSNQFPPFHKLPTGSYPYSSVHSLHNHTNTHTCKVNFPLPSNPLIEKCTILMELGGESTCYDYFTLCLSAEP